MLIQAESGLCSVTGGPNEPSRVGISIVDIATGATAHAAILEALIARSASGVGADIRIAMFDVIAEWLTVPLLNAEAGHAPKRLGLAHPSIAPYGAFTTRDAQRILLSVQSEREWCMLCDRVLQRADLAVDPRFASNVQWVRNRAATDRFVAAAIALQPRDALIATLSSSGIAFAELNDMTGLSQHPHLRRASLQTEGGPVSIPMPAAIVDGATRMGAAVPALGVDTATVTNELAAQRTFRKDM